MEQPKVAGLDLKSFLVYQQVFIDQTKANIDNVVGNFIRNIEKLVEENQSLTKKLAQYEACENSKVPVTVQSDSPF